MKFFTYFIIVVKRLSVCKTSTTRTKFKAKDQVTAANNYVQTHYQDTDIINPIVTGYSLIPILGVALRPLGTNICNNDESILAAEIARGRDLRRSHSKFNLTLLISSLPVIKTECLTY